MQTSIRTRLVIIRSKSNRETHEILMSQPLVSSTSPTLCTSKSYQIIGNSDFAVIYNEKRKIKKRKKKHYKLINYLAKFFSFCTAEFGTRVLWLFLIRWLQGVNKNEKGLEFAYEMGKKGHDKSWFRKTEAGAASRIVYFFFFFRSSFL